MPNLTITHTAPSSSAIPVSNPNNKDPIPHSKQGMTRQAIEAHLAEDTYTTQAAAYPDLDAQLGLYDSDRARNNVVSKKLIVLFMERFKMDAHQAKAAVEREMRDKYPPNPWDTPVSRNCRREGKTEASERSRAHSSPHGCISTTEYGKEQWDLFEKTFT